MGQQALRAHLTAHIDLQAGKGIDDNRNDAFFKLAAISLRKHRSGLSGLQAGHAEVVYQLKRNESVRPDGYGFFQFGIVKKLMSRLSPPMPCAELEKF